MMEVGRVVPELREGNQPEKCRFCSVAAPTVYVPIDSNRASGHVRTTA